MNLLNEIRLIKTGVKELRSFGIVVGGIFAALGILFLWKGKPSAPFFLVVGIPLIFFGLTAPKILKQIYIVWMSIGLILGAVIAPVILTLLYYFAVTPIGIIARLSGKKFLDTEFKQDKDTYWIPKDNSKRNSKSYDTQF